MVKSIETLNTFAKLIYKIAKSDRDAIVGVGGFTGEGKSTFSTLLQKEYAEISGTTWSFDRMTWSRKELMTWIDGKRDSKIDPNTGLRQEQLPEYSAMLPDELFSMFYRRNWYEDEQIDAIATFNMCRDRHLFICGNVPNFWELDSGFTNRVRFYVYIPYRGVAWVFEQENNPFSTDPWDVSENRKKFRKKKHPYSIINFLFEIQYPDWNPDEKQEYLKIRNEKRVNAITDNKSERVERYHDIKTTRDNIVRFMFEYNKQVVTAITKKNSKDLKEASKKFTNQSISDVTGLGKETIRLIRLGLR